MADKNQITQFNASRVVADTSVLCYAPWLSMNFDQTGQITVCCFNRTFVLGSYPQQRLSDIWQGKNANKLRQAMQQSQFNLGCGACEKMIAERNFESVLIKHFDDYYDFLPPKADKSLLDKFFNTQQLPQPTVFEFELSNTCNLECIMCGGKWSSAIRSNREKLPALPNYYDSNFVQELKPFLPGLKRANFLGGEPFLIAVYQEIWECIIDINPDIDVAITSNGTVLNSRIKAIIERLPKLRLTLSIDSLKKETWQAIRRKGKFETLKENMDYFMATGKLVSFSVCPMVQNRMEIPEIVGFCEQHNLDIYFNVVYEPLGGRVKGIHENGQFNLVDGDFEGELLPETSLQSLEPQALESLIEYYKSFSFKGRLQVQLNSLIKQLEMWKQTKEQTYVK
jgi:MoaA/NifB/PqqE/SkfB family radical SAM enzyme